MMENRRTVLALFGAALLLREGAWAGRWLPPPDLPDAMLLDHLGRHIDLNQVIRNRPVVVNFFFTGCATVCPPQTALLREGTLLWRKRPSLKSTLVISISVDGLGDGPEQLKSYGERFQLALGEEQGWLLVTGELAALARVLKAFDVPAGRPDEHPALLWLGNPAKGRWTRTSALNAPTATTRLLEELMS